MSAPTNRSVPPHAGAPPRALADDELRALLRIADVLMPGDDRDARPSATAGYTAALDRALAARADAFEGIVALAATAAALADRDLEPELRRLCVAEPARFQAVSAVLAGAYLTLPDVRARIGYPGQERRPAPFDQAAEEIMDGILDPVLARGSCFTPAPD